MKSRPAVFALLGMMAGSVTVSGAADQAVIEPSKHDAKGAALSETEREGS